MPETLGQAPGFAEVELYLPSSSSLTPGAGQAWEAAPGAQAGVFGMDPSWWVACQVEAELLHQMGSQQGVPPASRPWASGSLVTCQVAGTAPRGPRGPWGGRRRPRGPPRLQPDPVPGASVRAACRVRRGEEALPGPRPRRRRQGSAGAAGTRPRLGPTSLRPVPRCRDPDSGLRVESTPRSVFRDPGLGDLNSGFQDLSIRAPGFPNPSSRVPHRPGSGQIPLLRGRFRIQDLLRPRLPPLASGGLEIGRAHV